jgi:23S rRNA (guanosine2251-2'-O)-methyltransferase
MKHYQNKPEKSGDRPSKQSLLIGIRALTEAIHAGKEIDKVLVQQGLKGELIAELRLLMHKNNIVQQVVPLEKLNRISRNNHQGVIAFISPISFGSLDNVIAHVFETGNTPLFVLLDGITDVRNMGAICRSAECLGAHAIILPEKGSAQINEEAVKTSAGAMYHIPVCRVKSIGDTVELLQQSGIQVVGCTEKSSTAIEEVDLTKPSCIVMGAEDTGISDVVLRKSDLLALIPMYGKTASLNVAVSAGIILNETARQRRIHKGFK